MEMAYSATKWCIDQDPAGLVLIHTGTRFPVQSSFAVHLFEWASKGTEMWEKGSTSTTFSKRTAPHGMVTAIPCDLVHPICEMHSGCQ